MGEHATPRPGHLRSAHVVLLDALGTLIELEPPAPLLVQALARRGLDVSEAAAGQALAAEIAYYREHHLEGSDPAALEALRTRCAAVLAAALPPAAIELRSEQLTAALLEALRFRAFGDAAPALDALRAGGRTLVVVSNWDCGLADVLDRCGLGGRVDHVVSSARAGVAKPAPEIFEQALTLAGARASEAVHVGDRIHEDVGGARAAGVEPLLLVRSARGAPPAGVRVIGSLGELS